MHDESSQHERILEALEACRAGRDDLRDAELAALAARLAEDADLRDRLARVQRLDARLAEAIDDVPVPEGLAERLLAGLAAPSVEAAGVAPSLDGLAICPTASASDAAPRPSQPQPVGPKRVSRRWLVVAGGAFSTAAALLIAAWWLGWKEPRHLTPSLVLQEATELFRTEAAPPGQLVADAAPPADYPLSRDVSQLAEIRWRAVRGLFDRSGVAYDLVAPDGTRATLYVVRRGLTGLPAEPPSTPDLTTAGCSAAAWQEAGLLYVLVVDGGPRAYHGFLRLSSGPIT